MAKDNGFKHNPFAELAELEKDARKARRKAEAAARAEEEARKKAAQEAQKPAPPDGRSLPDDRDLDDMELFEEAMADFNGDIYLGKYGRPGDLQKSREEAKDKPRLTQLEKEVSLFEQEMAGVERLDPSDKKRVVFRKKKKRKLPDNLEPNRASLTQDNTARPRPVDQKSVQLNKGQRKLIDDVRKHEKQVGPVNTLTLRGLSKNVAVARLEAFLQEEARRGGSFARIITGKGKRSEGEPIIKRTTVAILEDHERVVLHSPEVNRDGNYGSVVVQLRN